MQLEAEMELGLKPNLMLVEDFSNDETCDKYYCKVIGEVAGVNGVYIETDKGILTGHYYTITDGTRSEYVRVKPVEKNGEYIYAIFESKLTKTYNLEQTRLMRSTALFRDNSALGASEIRSWTNTNGVGTWKGKGTNEEQTLTLETTIANADAFDLSGQYAFTDDGAFTCAN